MNTDEKLLRRIIREKIKRALEVTVEEPELITEPDDVSEEPSEEASAGGVAGVTTPLGTGPTFPKNRK